MTRPRLLALGGVAGPVLFTACVLVFGALRPGYSHAAGFISELGQSGSAYAAWMNLLGFIPAGLLITGFGWALSALVPRSRLTRAAAALIIAFGVAMTGAGVFSCDTGCPRPPRSTEDWLHTTLSVAGFLCAVLGIALWAVRFRQLPEWRGLWVYSALTAAVALVFLLMVNATIDARTTVGAWQRLFVGTLFAWFATVGLRSATER